ncbi:MAG: hypothetical protein ACOYXT_25230 [Bacteroidota bacterium]
MKKIRTVNGVKQLNYYNDNELLQRIRETLTDHRATLINMLLGGLHDYVDYKFHQKIDKTQADRITERLLSLKNSPVVLDGHEAVIEQLMKTDFAMLNNATFYEEIDTSIQYSL